MLAYCQGNPVNFQDAAGTRMVHADPYRGGPLPDKDQKSDEQKAFDAKIFAIYKGVPVIFVRGNSSFSFGIIFMGKDGGENLLRHEYGHTLQLKKLGVKKYFKYVVKPSVARYKKTKNMINPEIYNWDTYYSTPWEYQADQLGGVVDDYLPWAREANERYWNLVNNLIP